MPVSSARFVESIQPGMKCVEPPATDLGWQLRQTPRCHSALHILTAPLAQATQWERLAIALTATNADPFCGVWNERPIGRWR